MTNDPRDGLELLRANNPVDESTVEGSGSPRAQELLNQVLASPKPDHTTKRYPLRRVRITVVWTVVALATTAAAWLWTRPIERPNAVLCYQQADLQADVAAAPAGSPATADACAPVWQESVLVNADLTPRGSVPPLTACVSENGALAVFPTGDPTVCDDLGLAHPEPASQESADAVRRLELELVSYFLARDCITMTQAETDVRRILNQTSFSDWAIQSQPEVADRPCASFSLDARAKTIHLVPIPRPSN